MEKKMEFLTALMIGTGLLLIIISGGTRVYDLITDKGFYGWPAVTQCRGCNKTVWEWQSYERRSFTMDVDGDSQNIIVGMSASGIMHKKCKGNPSFEVKVEVK